ncbi:MAG: Asp23/Gls24 family envelope stress response protein, partial [Atribacterota bacterium]|nr:Asp23/Gls24 family envelope stress response protein [Atribacterota bacterium]
MEYVTINNEKGNINVSRSAIETLSQLILLETKRIIKPKDTTLNQFYKKYYKKNPDESAGIVQDIKIEIKPKIVIINLFLVINYGIRIPDLTWEIQAKIKEKFK